MNDNQLSIAGNLVADPERREVAGGRSMVTFRIASTPRRFDAAHNEWRNGESIFLDVVCWQRLADRVAACLRKGDPVTLAGRLRMHAYEVDGHPRSRYELEAQQVSPDLNRVDVALRRVERGLRPTPVPVGSPVPPLDDVAVHRLDSGPLVSQQAEPAA